MKALLSLAIAMFAGLMMTRLLKKTHLPDVTAYLIAGVLIGPCFIGALGTSQTRSGAMSRRPRRAASV